MPPNPPTPKGDEAHLDIDALSEASGIPSSQLHDWERRYGVPSRSRVDDHGVPRYSTAEARRLEEVRAMLDAGATEQEALGRSH